MPRALAQSVHQVARQAAGKDWGLYATLIDRWTEIVGAAYADVTTPVKITFPYQPQQARRTGGTLTIRLPKGLAMEFSFKSEIIRQRVNTYFGHDAFAKIALEPAHGYFPPPKKRHSVSPEITSQVQAATADIEQDDLRAALASFGEMVVK